MSFDEKDLFAALKQLLPDLEIPSESPVAQLMTTSRWDKKLANPAPPADPMQAPETKAKESAAEPSDK